MMKPEVKYKHINGCAIKEGQQAIVFPINHPDPVGVVSNTKPVFTSTVLFINSKTKSFETRNTAYVYDGEYEPTEEQKQMINNVKRNAL